MTQGYRGKLTDLVLLLINKYGVGPENKIGISVSRIKSLIDEEKETEVNLSSLESSILNLKKDKLLAKVDRGHYKLTKKGKDKVDKIKSREDRSPEDIKKTIEKDDEKSVLVDECKLKGTLIIQLKIKNKYKFLGTLLDDEINQQTLRDFFEMHDFVLPDNFDYKQKGEDVSISVNDNNIEYTEYKLKNENRQYKIYENMYKAFYKYSKTIQNPENENDRYMRFMTNLSPEIEDTYREVINNTEEDLIEFIFGFFTTTNKENKESQKYSLFNFDDDKTRKFFVFSIMGMIYWNYILPIYTELKTNNNYKNKLEFEDIKLYHIGLADYDSEMFYTNKFIDNVLEEKNKDFYSYIDFLYKRWNFSLNKKTYL